MTVCPQPTRDGTHTVLDALATETPANLTVAAAIALYLSNAGTGFTGEAAVAGYWG